MKHIKKNRSYDTATASVLAVYYSCDDAFNPAFYTEALYYKYATREYFLHLCGNERSLYGCPHGRMYSLENHQLIVVSRQEAKRWFLSHISANLPELLVHGTRHKKEPIIKGSKTYLSH